MKNFESFTGVYPLQKTLKFELIPVDNTKIHMDMLYSGILKKDQERADLYPEMKMILDDYYRYFISVVLEDTKLDESIVKEAFEIYCNLKKNKNNKDLQNSFAKIKEVLRKKLASEFKEKKEEYGLNEYSKLFKETKIETKKSKDANGKASKSKIKITLIEWLKMNHGNGKISDDEFKNKNNVIKYFDNFTTYFIGFQENRENMFSESEKATSIMSRVIDTNMIKHFENIIRFEIITKEMKQFAEYENIFCTENMNELFSQEGIDKYNTIIGRKADDKFDAGINQKINEINQKLNIKLPIMTQLYKQILSKEENMFYINELKNDEELCSSIEKLREELNSNMYLEKLQKIVKEKIKENNIEWIYIKDSSITSISQDLFGRWNFINEALLYSKIKNEAELNAENKKSATSIKEIQSAVTLYNNSLDEINAKNIDDRFLEKYFTDKEFVIENLYENVKLALGSGVIDKNRSLPKDEYDKGGYGYQQIKAIRDYLDELNAMVRFYKPFELINKGQLIVIENCDVVFHESITAYIEGLSIVDNLYNRVRNYLTKKPYSTDKVKLNFGKPTLLAGWDKNKESDNLSVLLIGENCYYLGIMNSSSNKVFDFSNEKLRMKALVEKFEEKDCYNKVEYKQVAGAAKMFPKVFFGQSNSELYRPSAEILNIRENKLHLKDKNDEYSKNAWINFCKESINKHPDWTNFFEFNFKKTEEYSDVNEFYKDADACMYSLNMVPIKKSYIDELTKNGQLFLFKIYNKDFSYYSKGKPNLHTLYWKMIFDNINILNIKKSSEKPVFKLNGEAEVFIRKASLPKVITHKANEAIKNKNPNVAVNKPESIFDYDLYKDKRFMSDKLFFHCPMTINFRTPGISTKIMNEKVNCYIENNKDINIIGIDRGERHLLYYTIINQKGEIIKQDTFNSIKSSYKNDDREIDVETDYRGKLDEKEKERLRARREWGTIENIKEIKQGYLSAVIHELTELIIDNNAIVVLENLNTGFKRSRVHVEKQVYQNFEKALIQKLSYLVKKENGKEELGGVLRGYQLAAPFESFQKLGVQSGVIYYVVPAYTSKICPKTGFVNMLNTRYKDIKESKLFFDKFDEISFNKSENFFEFKFDYKEFGNKAVGRENWTVCTTNEDRYNYNSKDKKIEKIDVTEKLKELFTTSNIKWESGSDIRKEIVEISDKQFFVKLYNLLKITIQMRNSNGGTSDKDDYILSPIKGEDGTFFDSRNGCKTEPKNADANGAYHIALKGLMMMKGIENGKMAELKKGKENEKWFKFAQEKGKIR